MGDFWILIVLLIRIGVCCAYGVITKVINEKNGYFGGKSVQNRTIKNHEDPGSC